MGTGPSSPTKSRLPSPLRRKHASTHPTVAPRLIDFSVAGADQSTGCVTPPRRPAVQEDAMEEEKGEETESTDYVFHISGQAARRIKVCTLMEQGFSCKQACKDVGISRPSFIKKRWYERYQEDGMGALLDDKRGRKPTQMTPTTVKKIKVLGGKGLNAPDIQAAITDDREEAGDPRAAPSLRGVQGFLGDTLGGKYGRGHWKFMVKTPWHARWRIQFCKEWYPLLTAPPKSKQLDLGWILFTDEKKFCLWDSRFARWWFPDSEPNIAKALDMSDEQYLQWRKDNGKPLPNTKQRGLYPCFVWGGVGYNMKTELYFLEEKQRLTADIYRTILAQNLYPRQAEFERKMRRAAARLDPNSETANGRWKDRGPHLIITQDNDSKHYNDTTRQLLANRNIYLMSSLRKKADGSHPDRAPGPGGHLKNWSDAYFPCYSPDLNGPIEKAWRECQNRVLKRHREITGRADMIKVIKEEWAGLEFEPSDRWCGINHLVSNVPKAMLECIQVTKGYDTSYHKH